MMSFAAPKLIGKMRRRNSDFAGHGGYFNGAFIFVGRAIFLEEKKWDGYNAGEICQSVCT